MQPTQPPSQVLDFIFNHDGVLAVATTGAAVGDGPLSDVLSRQLALFDLPYMADQTSFRVNIGKENASVLVMRNESARIAIATPSGHPIIKSCKRLARGALKKLAAPVVATKDSAASSIPAAASS